MSKAHRQRKVSAKGPQKHGRRRVHRVQSIRQRRNLLLNSSTATSSKPSSSLKRHSSKLSSSSLSHVGPSVPRTKHPTKFSRSPCISSSVKSTTEPTMKKTRVESANGNFAVRGDKQVSRKTSLHHKHKAVSKSAKAKKRHHRKHYKSREALPTNLQNALTKFKDYEKSAHLNFSQKNYKMAAIEFAKAVSLSNEFSDYSLFYPYRVAELLRYQADCVYKNTVHQIHPLKSLLQASRLLWDGLSRLHTVQAPRQLVALLTDQKIHLDDTKPLLDTISPHARDDLQNFVDKTKSWFNSELERQRIRVNAASFALDRARSLFESEDADQVSHEGYQVLLTESPSVMRILREDATKSAGYLDRFEKVFFVNLTIDLFAF